MKNFQVIGQCVEMQILSWENELRLLDGVPYDIDFSRGAFIEIPAEATLRDVPVSSIIRGILCPPEVPALPASTATAPPAFDWNEVDRQMKKKKKREKKRKKKWKRNHPKRSFDEAYEDFCDQLKEWGVY